VKPYTLKLMEVLIRNGMREGVWRMILKRFLTFMLILMLVFSTFSIFAPKAKAQVEPGVIEAENENRVTRIPDYYIGYPNYIGWEEEIQYVDSEEMHVMFTVGQHKEELQFNFLGYGLNISFYSFRSGIARIIIDENVSASERVHRKKIDKTVDTFSGDNNVDKKLVAHIADLNYTDHTARVIATGERYYARFPNGTIDLEHSSAAEYIYVDAFIIPGLDNKKPTAKIESITPSPATRNEVVTLNGSGTDDDGHIDMYEWDFTGDGTYDWSSQTSGVTTCQYATAGTYYPTFRVKDNKGLYSDPKFACLVIDPLPPDLQISSSDITFTYTDSGTKATISAEVHNIGEQNAGSFTVNFTDVTPPSQFLGSKTIPFLAAQSSQTTSLTWNSPTSGHTIKVEVDANYQVKEGNEGNNIVSKDFTGQSPVVNKITAYVVVGGNTYLITDTSGRVFMGIRNIGVKVRFEASVSDAENNIKHVNFTLNGHFKLSDATFPYYCEFDIGTDGDVDKLWPQNNVLKVKARDTGTLESNELSMNFMMIKIPDWVKSIGNEKLKFSFDTSTMSYKIEFTYEILKGESDGPDDPVNKGKKNGISDFSVNFCIEYSMATWKATISGGGDLSLKLLGLEPKITVTITGVVNSTLGLEEATIEVQVEIELPSIPVAGISFKFAGIKITLGVVIEGKITVNVKVTFIDDNGTFKMSELSVTVKLRFEGKIEAKLPPIPFIGDIGAYAGVYAEVTIKGQNVKPTLSVTVEVGVMAGAYADGLRYEWSRGWKTTWNKDPFYFSKKEWAELPPGTDISYGNNTIVNDPYREESPYIASDSNGNTMAVWVYNMSLYATNVYYSIWNGTAWSEPKAITDNSYYKMQPVLTFDSNNNAILVWTQVNKSFSSSSTMNDYLASTSKFELYYSKWNGSKWTTPTPITNDNATDYGPAIAADRFGHVMVVWTRDKDGNFTTQADTDIYYSLWNGTSWSVPSWVSNMTQADFDPSVAYDTQGKAVVAWVHDNNSTVSIFDDAPPAITNATVTPDPVVPFQPVNIKARVTDYMGLYRVYASVRNPGGGYQTIDLVLNENTKFYEGIYVPTQSGTYRVSILAEDLLNQTDWAMIAFRAFSTPPPDTPPVIVTSDATPDLLYTGDLITIRAHVTDNIGVTEVTATIYMPDGTEIYQHLDPVNGTPQDGIYQTIFPLTSLPGYYDILIHVSDTSMQTDYSWSESTVRPRNINQEIVYAKWNGIAWGNPTNVTNPTDARESYTPSVAFDIWNNAIIVWTEYDGNIYKIYHFVDSPFFGLPRALPDPGGHWNLDPVIKTTNIGTAIITLRADPSNWGDIYYLILNTTQYRLDYYEKISCGIRRVTKDTVTDWKHSVTIDSNANLIIAWLKHRATNVGNYTHPEMFSDDDDIYYKVIYIGAPDLEIEPSDIKFSTPATLPIPRVGDIVRVNATIHNTGTFDLKNILVLFFDDDPSEGGTTFAFGIIPLLKIGENVTLSRMWPATFGDHEIYVAVDPLNRILENNEMNNNASKRILVSTFLGAGLEDIRRYIGNVTISHSDTVSLILGEVIDVVFSGPGTSDYIITQGNPILITIVNNETTPIPMMPSINITLTHSGPASLRITNSSVTATFSWLGINNQIIIRTMNTTGNVILNHTTPASVAITNKDVEVTFTLSSLDEVLLPWMGTYVKVKHLNSVRIALENVSDPKLATGNATENSIDKFIDIASFDTFEWATIRIYYTEEDLNGLNESKLRMHYWNPATQEWIAIGNSGVNTAENYVWANVTHFSVFTAIEVIGIHNVAVTDVRLAILGKTIVRQNLTLKINATVQNQGNFTENFSVTVYANTTIIETKTNITLTGGNSTTLTFTWNTTGFVKGNYTISAYAWPVIGEIDFDDNNCTDGWVFVTWLGDLDGDFDVDEDDLWMFCEAFIDYYKIHVKDPLCDFDDDCDIDEDDLWTFCEAFIDYWKGH